MNVSHGIVVEGDAGNVLIDDTYPVFQVIEQGYIEPAVGGAGSYLHKMQFLRKYDEPPLLILFPPDGSPGWLHTFRFLVDSEGKISGFSAELTGTQYEFNGYIDPDPFIGGSRVANITPAGRAFGWKYAVASSDIPVGAEPYGIRVWGSDGALVYDSAWPLAYFRAPMGDDLQFVRRELVGNMNQYETYRNYFSASVPFGSGAKVGILASSWASKFGQWAWSAAVGFDSGDRSRVSLTIKEISHVAPLGGTVDFYRQNLILAAI